MDAADKSLQKDAQKLALAVEARAYKDLRDAQADVATATAQLQARLDVYQKELDASAPGYSFQDAKDAYDLAAIGAPIIVAVTLGTGGVVAGVIALGVAGASVLMSNNAQDADLAKVLEAAAMDLTDAMSALNSAKSKLESAQEHAENATLAADTALEFSSTRGEQIKADREEAEAAAARDADITDGTGKSSSIYDPGAAADPDAQNSTPSPYADDEVASSTGHGEPDMTVAPEPLAEEESSVDADQVDADQVEELDAGVAELPAGTPDEGDEPDPDEPDPDDVHDTTNGVDPDEPDLTEERTDGPSADEPSTPPNQAVHSVPKPGAVTSADDVPDQDQTGNQYGAGG